MTTSCLLHAIWQLINIPLALTDYQTDWNVNGVSGFRFLVEGQWFKQWKLYVGFEVWDQQEAGLDAADPGPIDNKRLFKGALCGKLT